MKWSWKLGKIAGIDLSMHATFLLIIGWVALNHWLEGQTLAATVAGVLFVLALFGCVVLHELGHALAARHYGIRTRDITLLPIGGLARLERMPEDPRQELWVALAGPAVNVVIAAALFLWLSATNSLVPLERLNLGSGSFLERLMVVNLFLVVFNLLPAFPMDGGRVVRALLATRIEYTRATHIAASLGQGMALLFGFIGLFYNPFLVFIAVFVWIGAAQEASMVQMKSSLGGIPVSSAMVTDFRTLDEHAPLSDAVRAILTGTQQDFPVTGEGSVRGVLTRSDLLVALASRGQEVPVGEVMRRQIAVVDAGDMLETALGRLHECNCHTLPVTYRGELVGLLTTENVGEFVALQAALRKRGGAATHLFGKGRN